MTPDRTPEKSTRQLAVWQDLVQALDQLEVAWQHAQTIGARSASAQLPANIATALAKATERGARALAGTADMLVAQHDSGAAFAAAATRLRQVADEWPRR